MIDTIIRVYFTAKKGSFTTPMVFQLPRSFDLSDSLLRIEDYEGKDYMFPFSSIAYFSIEEVKNED